MPKQHAKNIALKISRNIIRRSYRICLFYLRFRNIHQHILSWINSKEFKETYKNTKHPYPPLLNPKNFNYKNTPAELAWYLNIPLQENYEFIFLAMHGCGMHAMQTFFQQCNVVINTRFNKDMADYIMLYNFLNNKKQNDYIAIWLRAYSFENDKLYYLITKKVPVLCVVRDPVSLLKPFINHLGYIGYERVSPITLDTPYNQAILPPDYMFFQKDEEVNVGRLDKVISYVDGHEYFLARKIQLLQKNIESFHYIPFQSIGIEHGFDTFCKLATQFGFQKPRDKSIFQTKLNGGNRIWFFPIDLICSKEPYIEVHITIHTDSRINDSNYQNLTDLLVDKQPAPDYQVAIIIHKKQFALLQTKKQLLGSVYNYIKGYILYLQKMEDKERMARVDEDKIIAYFRNNKETSKHFYDLINREYAHLKANRPDIIESWQYYKEFMDICDKVHKLS